jgi:hypothetical protein
MKLKKRSHCETKPLRNEAGYQTVDEIVDGLDGFDFKGRGGQLGAM